MRAGMTTAVIVGLTALSLYALHRLARWAERRGWIYYLERRPSRGALGNAFLEVQALLEPASRQLLEVRQAEPEEEDEQGEPPRPGEDTAPRRPD
jgi:hypothetical protein